MGTYGVFYFLYGMIFCLILILFLEVKCIKILMMSHELKSFLICFNNAGVFSIFVHLNKF